MTAPRRGPTSTHGTSTGGEHWAERGACRNVDPELFFTENHRDVADAKAICRGCDVQPQCLREALTRGEGAGVWGGELFVAGKVVKPKRRVITQDAA